MLYPNSKISNKEEKIKNNNKIKKMKRNTNDKEVGKERITNAGAVNKKQSNKRHKIVIKEEEFCYGADEKPNPNIAKTSKTEIKYPKKPIGIFPVAPKNENKINKDYGKTLLIQPKMDNNILFQGQGYQRHPPFQQLPSKILLDKIPRVNPSGYTNISPKMSQHMSRMYSTKNKPKLMLVNELEIKANQQTDNRQFKFVNYDYQGQEPHGQKRCFPRSQREIEAAIGLTKLISDLKEMAERNFIDKL